MNRSLAVAHAPEQLERSPGRPKWLDRITHQFWIASEGPECVVLRVEDVREQQRRRQPAAGGPHACVEGEVSPQWGGDVLLVTPKALRPDVETGQGEQEPSFGLELDSHIRAVTRDERKAAPGGHVLVAKRSNAIRGLPRRR